MAAFSGTSRPGGVFSARPPTTPSRRGRSRRGPLPPSPDTRCPCAEGSRGCPEMCRRWNAVRGTGMNRRASASGCGSAPLACRAFSSKIASYVVFFIAWTKLHTRSGRDPPFARVRVGRVSYSHGSLSCSLAGWGLSKLSVDEVGPKTAAAGRPASGRQIASDSRIKSRHKLVEKGRKQSFNPRGSRKSSSCLSASSAWSCIFFRCPAAGGGARQALSLCLLSNLRPRAISYAIDRGPRAGRRR